MSMLTNWLGYILLAGLVFTIAPLQLPLHWSLDSEELRMLGAGLLAFSVVYLSCAFSPRRSWTVRGHEIELPTLRMAFAQLSISCTHWLTMAAALGAAARPGGLPDRPVRGADGRHRRRHPAHPGRPRCHGSRVHRPAVAERIPEHQLLGALLAYRALFYLTPPDRRCPALPEGGDENTQARARGMKQLHTLTPMASDRAHNPLHGNEHALQAGHVRAVQPAVGLGSCELLERRHLGLMAQGFRQWMALMTTASTSLLPTPQARTTDLLDRPVASAEPKRPCALQDEDQAPGPAQGASARLKS